MNVKDFLKMCESDLIRELALDYVDRYVTCKDSNEFHSLFCSAIEENEILKDANNYIVFIKELYFASEEKIKKENERNDYKTNS